MKQQPSLGVFSLVMINIIAIDNLRTLPFAAGFGFGLVGVYLLASIVFLVPVGVVSAKLATILPNRGGIYVWVKQAFDSKVGFFIIWLQWIYNVVWYPTALAFILAIVSHAFGFSFVENSSVFLWLIVAMFWFATFINCFGMKVSGLVSTVCAIMGTLIPMAIIIWLGVGFFLDNNLSFVWKDLIPQKELSVELPFLVEIVFGLVGLEMSAMHADQVKNPSKAYPKAIFWSVIIIFVSLVMSSLSVAVVVPSDQLNVMTGISQALVVFLQARHLSFLYPLMIVLIVIGSIGSVAAWIIGPSKGLLIAAEDGVAPKYFAKRNKHGVPVRILVLQAILVSLLSGVYALMPSLEGAYVLLTAMTTQLSLIVYIGLFLAAIKLKKSLKFANNFNLLLCCGVGLFSCVFVILLGFVPPEVTISVEYVKQYIFTLIIGMIVLCLPPFIFMKNLKTNK